MIVHVTGLVAHNNMYMYLIIFTRYVSTNQASMIQAIEGYMKQVIVQCVRTIRSASDPWSVDSIDETRVYAAPVRYRGQSSLTWYP